jgi:uncharacterized membrane protein
VGEKEDTPPVPATLPAAVAKIADPVIEALPLANRAAVAGVIARISSFHSGPLPDADTLREYGEIIPDGAERIMALVEGESAHRHKQEDRLVTCNVILSHRGQWIGLGLTLLFGLAGYQLGMNGHDVLAGVVFTTTIIGIITVFVLGRVFHGSSGPPPSEPG